MHDTDSGDDDSLRPHEQLALARLRSDMLGRGKPMSVGRYELRRELGRGSFGAVFEARDPKLDRTVAIKLVRSLPGTHGDVVDRRILREARALAALGHPNVVEVYDFGKSDQPIEAAALGDDPPVYIVMEHLRGDTLRDWLLEHNPPWRTVVEVFAKVADGLQAAHELGIVHRDVKPDNVMITAQGPKLVDFGLAAPVGAGPDSQGPSAIEAQGPRATRTGIAIGTPAYMSPEQHAAKPATPATDQYALCVALWEALWGTRPFPADDVKELAADKRQEAVLEPPDLGGIPRAVMLVLRRGISADTTERYGSIGRLAAALRKSIAVRRRRWPWVAGAAVVVGTAVTAVWLGVDRCQDLPKALPMTEVEGRIAAAFEQSGIAQPVALGDEVGTRLKAYTASWSVARQAACESRVAGTWDDRRHDAVVRCLDRVAVRARALVDVLAQGDRLVLATAGSLVGGLPSPARCERDAAVDGEVEPLAGAIAIEVDELGRDLERNVAAIRTPGAADALERTAQIVTRARSLDYGPLLARALLAKGKLEIDQGHFDAAQETLTEAVWTAEVAHRPSIAADAVPHVLSSRAGDGSYDEAEAFIEHGLQLLDQAQASPRLRARVHNSMGKLYLARSRFDEARTEFHRASEQLEGLEDPAMGATRSETLMGLSAVVAHAGDMVEAIRLCGEAVRHMTEANGPWSPSTAAAHERVGGLHHQMSNFDAAAAEYEHAISIFRTVYGEDHPEVAWTTSVLAMIWLEQGRKDEAARAAKAALAAVEATVQRPTEQLGAMLFNLSVIEQRRGDGWVALGYATRAYEAFASVMGPRSWDAADAMRHRATLLIDLERKDEARELLDRSLAVFEELGAKRDVEGTRAMLAELDR